jgi:hypothetical protein
MTRRAKVEKVVADDDGSLEREKFEQFERSHPEGIESFIDKAIEYYLEKSRHLENQFIAVSELLGSIKERKDLRLKLHLEYEAIKEERGDIIRDDESKKEEVFVPEVTMQANMPNLVQEVTHAVGGIKPAGVSEINVNKLEMHIIRTLVASRSLVSWLMKVLKEIYKVLSPMNRYRNYSDEVRSYIEILRHSKRERGEDSGNNSLSRTDSPNRHSPHASAIPTKITTLLDLTDSPIDKDQILKLFEVILDLQRARRL